MSASVPWQQLFSRRDALVYDADLAGDGIGPGVFGDRRAGNAFAPMDLLLLEAQRVDMLLGGGDAFDCRRHGHELATDREHRRTRRLVALGFGEHVPDVAGWRA